MIGGAAPGTDDGTLFDHIARSDVGALEELYDRYGGQVYSLSYGILQNAAAAAEVTRETFLAIWRGASAFDAARGSPRNWILSLAHRESLAAARLHRTEATATEALMNDVGVVTYAMRSGVGARVQHAIDALPAEQRTVLVLAYYGGYTQRQIAERTGAPLEVVRTRARESLLSLHAAFEADRATDDR